MPKKHTHPCAIAATLNILGDRWSLLIIREAFYGATRFGEFLTNTGISRNLLTERLNQLVEDGVMEKIPFADRGTSYAYQLTEKGRALDTILMAMSDWGSCHVYGDGNEPVRMMDEATGGRVSGLLPVTSDGTPVSRDQIRLELGPGGDGRTRARLSRAKSHPFRTSEN